MENIQIHDTIRDIKSQFRLFMNGVISQSMREKGMGYKLNFGIEYPRIKEIAQRYPKDHQLAQALWKENIRECKIMATLLQPVDTFYPEIAEIWVEDMQYSELAEYAVMNLFQYLPYASESAFCWMADGREYFQLCGFLLMARLLMKKMKLSERAEAEFLDQAFTALEDESFRVRKSAVLALCKFGLQSRDNRKTLGKMLGAAAKNAGPELAGCLDEIKAEIEMA